MVGRYFMEHPRDHALTLLPSTPALYRDAAFYDARTAPISLHATGGEPRPRFEILGRFALAADFIRRECVLNASATLLPIVRPWPARARAWLPNSTPRLARWLPNGGHGWSRHPSPRRVFDGFRVLLNLEQRPQARNRVVLGSRQDAFGLPRPELHWGLTAGERGEIDRARRLFARELERAGFGRVTIRDDASIDPNAHHHAGTTRMHRDPRYGVVDEHGRVHSVANVFVAGASVFPTAGFANPVLTTVALSLKLGDSLVATL
jgi:hypothetical protein